MSEDSKNKIVTLSVPPKYMKTLQEFCKVMSFSVLTTEQTIEKHKIDCWEDIHNMIKSKLGPGFNSERFIDDMAKISITGTIFYLSSAIIQINYPEKKEGFLSLKALKNPKEYFSDELAECIEIVKDKFIPLLNEGKGK